ncbi:IcmT/TraK family protein [Pseudomonas mosselii]|uniref:Conjugal transfer protein n=1 Tax=Pseudomonas mosselii TaxID=78327 RepID=A0A7W2JZS1_9PSED|nr:IcmT/TraK family protein [Pseudomonas mosselii]MBA6068127.1 conjugal transfer protein [Pseudomonas mosselii]
MSDQDDPGYWKNAGRHLGVFGIPAPLFLLYLFWFRFPSWMTVYVITAVLAVFWLLSYFGWTFDVMVARVVYLVRGSRIYGRPWWYRRFTDKE